MLRSVKWMFTRVSIHKMFGKTRMEGCLIQCIILWGKITWQKEHLDIWKEVSSCQKDVSLKYRLQALGQNPAWRHILLDFHIFKKQQPKRVWPPKSETVFSGCPCYPLSVVDSVTHIPSWGSETLVLCLLLKGITLSAISDFCALSFNLLSDPDTDPFRLMLLSSWLQFKQQQALGKRDSGWRRGGCLSQILWSWSSGVLRDAGNQPMEGSCLLCCFIILPSCLNSCPCIFVVVVVDTFRKQVYPYSFILQVVLNSTE